LSQVIELKNSEQWIKKFEKANIPCAPVNSVDKAISWPQVLARNMIVKVKDKEGKAVSRKKLLIHAEKK